ncbi:2-keto-4-pentenoate hydratase [Anaerobacillus alkaliphilus]|uniref:2-keto-4-pentenoate hydratase n=1 Tax=Anaerobacillus alkaliphilus TaxID=1548597 RepID=A0A4V1LG27_9BACI|nr:2-keto-4-pentenoate hydratase [Anaerobacillus alkaliphilus]RXI98304.1 2-keto-4-pentenoate hydratase [Anaerobacillus alkaliphilus]
MTVTAKEFSEYLANAECNRRGVQPLTEIEPNLSVEEAYQIQLATVQRKIDQGQFVVGKKIGLTSVAMQNFLGVNEPDYGHLFNEMVVEVGKDISFYRVMQPKVEAEIAFILKEDLVGPNVTADDVLRATDYVVPALEIVDSRILNWKIKLADTIADNASSGLFVLGKMPVDVQNIDLAKVKMCFYKNGELVNTGVGSDVLGHPANCVAWLANKISHFGISLKAGEVILSGALSAAVDAKPGDEFKATIDALGEVNVRFAEGE